MTVVQKKCVIGIDVSKATLDVFVHPIGKHLQFPNNFAGIQKLVSKTKLFPSAQPSLSPKEDSFYPLLPPCTNKEVFGLRQQRGETSPIFYQEKFR